MKLSMALGPDGKRHLVIEEPSPDHPGFDIIRPPRCGVDMGPAMVQLDFTLHTGRPGRLPAVHPDDCAACRACGEGLEV